jgi:NSS family neurotransmitter:Na+ symporter
VIFLGWVMPEKDVRDEFTNHGVLSGRFYGLFRFLARYVVPVALLVVFVSGILM